MRIYLSGKITNNPAFNGEFEKLEDKVRKRFPEAEIFNPAKIGESIPKTLEHEKWMQLSFWEMDQCDTVVFMHNFKNSAGACMEYGYAYAKDMIMIHEETLDEYKSN